MRLKELRNKKGLKQGDVANLLGIPTRTYQNYERGVREPDAGMLCKLADIYETTIDDILGYSPSLASTLSADEERLVLLYRTTDKGSKAAIMTVAEEFASLSKRLGASGG